MHLKATPGKGILFTKYTDCQSVYTYTDAKWAKAINDKQFTSRYFTVVGENLITWKSKKTKCSCTFKCRS